MQNDFDASARHTFVGFRITILIGKRFYRKSLGRFSLSAMKVIVLLVLGVAQFAQINAIFRKFY